MLTLLFITFILSVHSQECYTTDEENVLTSGTKCDVELTIKYEESGVKSFGSFSFINSTIPKITIEGNFDTIPAGMFYNCKQLTEINLPSSISIIGSYAFSGTAGLTKVVIAEGGKYSVVDNQIISSDGTIVYAFGKEEVTELKVNNNVAVGAFEDNNAIRKVTINKDSTIDDAAFHASSVTNVVFKGKLNGKQIFSNCKNLEEVTIEGTTKNIPEATFSGCSNLKTVTIRESIETVGRSAFAYCEKLQEITLPTSVKYIEEDAFRGCTSLNKINIGELVKLEVIGSRAFYQSGVENVIIPSSVKTIEGYAFYQSKIQTIKIPSGVKKLVGVFAKCKQLGSVKLSEGLETIGASAFMGCPLDSLVIPATVNRIGFNAFKNCDSLKDVVYQGDNLEECGEGAFMNDAIEHITVPGGYKNETFCGQKVEVDDGAIGALVMLVLALMLLL